MELLPLPAAARNVTAVPSSWGQGWGWRDTRGWGILVEEGAAPVWCSDFHGGCWMCSPGTSQRNPCASLQTHAPENVNFFLPQQSYSRKYFFLTEEEEEGDQEQISQQRFFFSVLQPALTFIFSPILLDHPSHFPWGTSIIFNLPGTSRSLSQVPPHLGEFFRTFRGKGKKGRRCSGCLGVRETHPGMRETLQG